MRLDKGGSCCWGLCPVRLITDQCNSNPSVDVDNSLPWMGEYNSFVDAKSRNTFFLSSVGIADL